MEMRNNDLDTKVIRLRSRIVQKKWRKFFNVFRKIYSFIVKAPKTHKKKPHYRKTVNN
jgi:hypothetical protein